MALSLKSFVPIPLKRAIKSLLGLEKPAKQKTVPKPAKPAPASGKRTGGNRKTRVSAGASKPRGK